MNVIVSELPNGGFCISDLKDAELEDKIKDSLTFTNPKYEAAKRFSKWGTPTRIPRFLRYYDIPRSGSICVPYGFPISKFFPDLCNISDERGVNNKVYFSTFKYILRDSQREAYNAYFASLDGIEKHSQVVMPTGKGKAQPLYSKIMTPNGYTLMGDIKIGDEVFDSSGQICRVIGIYPQGKKKVYELTFSDGSKVRSSDEHLWFVKTHNEYRTGKPFKVKTLNEIMEMKLKDGRSYNLHFPKNEAVEYKNVIHKIHPYALGCLIGDGCMTAADKGLIYFSNTEQDIIDRLNNKLIEGYFDYNSATQCQYYRIKGSSKRGSRIEGVLVSEILRLGLNCKSGEKFIPKEYLISDKKSRMELLYGLFDTDGCVMPNGSFVFNTTSKQLSEDITCLCRSLGLMVSVRIKHREDEGKSTEYFVCIRTHEQIFTSEKHIKRNEIAVLSHSKNNINRYDTLRLVSIDYIGEEECQCIMVDSKDHSYLTDNFIVTHNTILALAIAAKLGVRTLVIVHKNDLIKVWREDIALALQMPAGLIQGNTRKIDNITIATVQTLGSMKKNGKFTDDFLGMFDFIIVDEAHHCPASTYEVIEDFRAKYRLGLTATPERNDGLTHVLNLFFGSPCYVYQESAEERDILPVIVYMRDIPLEYNPIVQVAEVTSKTNVVKIELINEFPLSVDMDKIKDFENMFFMSELRGQKIDFPENFNRQTMERSIANHVMTFEKVLLDLKFEVVTKHHSCILFFKQKEEVDFWYEKLQVMEIFNVAKYYGDNSNEINEQVLKDVESGKVNVTLATLAKCGEGTNCKAWESVFLISDIGNGKDVEQAIGRARRTKDGKEDYVTVYDYCYPNVQGMNYNNHSKVRFDRYKALNFEFRAFSTGFSPMKFTVGYPKRN